MPKITFQPSGVTIEVQPGTTVFNAAAQADVAIPSQCGGKCACALCRVKLTAGDDLVSPMKWDEEGHLGNAFFVTRERLSCQLQVWGDVTIEVSDAPVKEKQRGRYMPRSLIRKREQMEKDAEIERVRSEGRRAGLEAAQPGRPGRRSPRDGADRPPRRASDQPPKRAKDRPPRNAPPRAPGDPVAEPRDAPRHVATSAPVPVSSKPARRRRRRRSGGARPGDSRPPPGVDKPESS